MNKVILMGRLTREPDIRWTQGQEQKCTARYTLAVDRRYKKDGEQSADFISCVAFGRAAEFVEKYLRKGTKIVVSGRLYTGSYTNREGQKVYTTDVVIEEQEFAESKSKDSSKLQTEQQQFGRDAAELQDGFMQIPDGVDDEMPF